MELGDTVCTPTSPRCSKCSDSAQCRASSLSQEGGSFVTDYPPKVVKTKQGNDGGWQDANQYLLVKRPDKGLLAAIWEFPFVLLEKEASMANRRKVIDDFFTEIIQS